MLRNHPVERLTQKGRAVSQGTKFGRVLGGGPQWPVPQSFQADYESNSLRNQCITWWRRRESNPGPEALGTAVYVYSSMN